MELSSSPCCRFFLQCGPIRQIRQSVIGDDLISKCSLFSYPNFQIYNREIGSFNISLHFEKTILNLNFLRQQFTINQKHRNHNDQSVLSRVWKRRKFRWPSPKQDKWQFMLIQDAQYWSWEQYVYFISFRWSVILPAPVCMGYGKQDLRMIDVRTEYLSCPQCAALAGCTSLNNPDAAIRSRWKEEFCSEILPKVKFSNKAR